MNDCPGSGTNYGKRAEKIASANKRSVDLVPVDSKQASKVLYQELGLGWISIHVCGRRL